MELRFEVGDLAHPEVIALVELHLREAHRNSPADGVFALDLEGLNNPALTLWTCWEGERLLGMGALKALGNGRAEIKSMRTAPDALRRGVARVMLHHLLGEARARGDVELLLETGANDAFAPARRLYEAAGFRSCAPFGDYELTEFNCCYSLAVEQGSGAPAQAGN
jgi:putative acetyltransferase